MGLEWCTDSFKIGRDKSINTLSFLMGRNLKMYHLISSDPTFYISEGTHPPLTFGIMSGMNFCPPKPGLMVITRTMSTRETKGTTSSTGVPGLMPIPT